MSRVLDRWIAKRPGDAYALLEGWEDEIELEMGGDDAVSEELAEEYPDLGVYSQIAIFSIVADLLTEESRHVCPTCRGDGQAVYWAGGVPVFEISRDDMRGMVRHDQHWECQGFVSAYRGKVAKLRICRTCGGHGLIDDATRAEWLRANGGPR